MADITVLGSGGWGIALALTLYKNGNNVILYTKFKEEADELNKFRESKLLKGIVIPKKIKITTDTSSFNSADICVTAVPSFAVEDIAKLLKEKEKGIVVNVAKGFEPKTQKRLSEILKQYIKVPVAVLSGPSHAEEVARNVPTSLVVACEKQSVCHTVTETFSNENLRIYANDDICGVELGGALKNIIAVAGGFIDGLGLGDNTRAALITRGLTEIARLGVKMGAKQETFSGLSGLGDLIVTCTSVHSRNHRFGEKVANGLSVAEALKEVGTVEGYHAAKIVIKIKERYNVEMPICEQCFNVMYKNENVKDAIKSLMKRPQKDEHEISWIKE